MEEAGGRWTQNGVGACVVCVCAGVCALLGNTYRFWTHFFNLTISDWGLMVSMVSAAFLSSGL